MWTLTATKKKLTGPLGTYNSLKDQHLKNYFSNPVIRRQLKKAGLITEEGEIVPESVNQIKEIEEQRRKQAHELLANAIVQKTLELERLRQAEIQNHLENMNKIEMVERIKNARTKHKDSEASLSQQYAYRLNHSIDSLDLTSLLQKNHQRYRWDKSNFSLNYSVPNNLFASNRSIDKLKQNNMDQYPVRKGSSAKLHSEEKRDKSISLRSKSADPISKNSQCFSRMYRDTFKALLESPASPYLLPVLSKTSAIYSSQRPRLSNSARRKKNKKGNNEYKHQRKTEEMTAIDLQSQNSNTRMNRMGYLKLRKSVLQISESQCKLTLRYQNDLCSAYLFPNYYREVSIMQQHCGGNAICIFKNQLQPKDAFTFVSRRRHGFPFSITIFIDGIQHLRVSTCCEYRHQLGSRLGGKRGQFILINVQGGKPCFKCQVEESLGIYRPRHPPLPEYTKFLQKTRKVVSASGIQKHAVWNSSNENVELSKTNDFATEPKEVNALTESHDDVSVHDVQHDSEISQDDEKEIQEEVLAEEVSDNDDIEIKEELQVEIKDQEERDQFSESDIEEYIQNEEKADSDKEEICEIINEEDMDKKQLNSLSYQPSQGSDGDDVVPYPETCMSFEYNADSDEEDVDNRSDKKLHRQISHQESDENIDSDASYEERERNESIDEEEDDDEDDIHSVNNKWKHKLEPGQNYSFSSDEENEGIQQQVITADVHINGSIDRTKTKN